MPPNQLLNLILLLTFTWNKTLVHHYLCLSLFLTSLMFQIYDNKDNLTNPYNSHTHLKGKMPDDFQIFVWNFTLATPFLFFYIDKLCKEPVRCNCLHNRVNGWGGCEWG